MVYKIEVNLTFQPYTLRSKKPLFESLPPLIVLSPLDKYQLSTVPVFGSAYVDPSFSCRRTLKAVPGNITSALTYLTSPELIPQSHSES